LAAHEYRSAALPAASLPVSSADAPASTALPPGLLPAGSPGLAWRMARDIPDWGWIVIFLLPPMLISLRGRPLPRRAAAPPVVETGLRGAGEPLHPRRR